MYYQMYPALYTSDTFVFTNKFERELLNMKFATLQDAVTFAKETSIALREQNWYVYECCFFTKKRIALKTLYKSGYFSDKIITDDIGSYYNWE